MPPASKCIPTKGLRSQASGARSPSDTAQRPRPPRGSRRSSRARRAATRCARSIARFRRRLPPRTIQGYAEPHSLTIEPRRRPGESPRLLLFTGWTDYAFSSDNVAAHQAGLPSHAPSLAGQRQRRHMADRDRPEIGHPGRPAADDRGRSHAARACARRSHRGAHHHDACACTGIRSWWTRQRGRHLTTSRGSIRSDARSALARLLGRDISPTAASRSPTITTACRRAVPWKTMPGRYTREGDVRAAARTSTTIVRRSPRPGDEIALSFDAPRCRRCLSAGRARSCSTPMDSARR